MAHEVDPAEEVSHRNHNGGDNRLVNLSDVPHVDAHRNIAMNINNTSGVTGATWCINTERWAVSITVSNKKIWLGRYSTIEEAALVRANAEKKFGFHENHGK